MGKRFSGSARGGLAAVATSALVLAAGCAVSGGDAAPGPDAATEGDANRVCNPNFVTLEIRSARLNGDEPTNDLEGPPDPFVEVLDPERRYLAHTRPDWNTLRPVWDQIVDLDLIATPALILRVVDSDAIFSDPLFEVDHVVDWRDLPCAHLGETIELGDELGHELRFAYVMR